MTAKFDFDKPIDRRNTASMKWDRYRGTDILPMWLADMDFQSPPEVMAAIRQRVDHGVFGYSRPPEDLTKITLTMLKERYGWTVKRHWLVWLPGLVTGINVSCRAVGQRNDDVMTAIPVYPPFLTAPGFNERTLTTVPLTENEMNWTLDFDKLEQAVTPRTRLFLLCNPHNPVGRVFTSDELRRLVAFCKKHDLVICSDEIHCDLILDPAKTHFPTAVLDLEAADRTITLMAPSKTYNIAGLGCSFAVISNASLRERFKTAMAGLIPDVNILAFIAAEAAYRQGEPWRRAVIEYLRSNRDIVIQAVNAMPDLDIKPIEATYLAWIDTRRAGIQHPAAFFEKAGVGLNNGQDFGGPGFVRLNFGCPRATLETGLGRMAAAMATRTNHKGLH